MEKSQQEGSRKTVATYLSELAAKNERALENTLSASMTTDRVVQHLLKLGIVTSDEVRSTSNWKSESGNRRERLWRLLADRYPMKSESIRAAAAEVYAFREAIVSSSDAVAFVQSMGKRFTPDQWDELVRLKTLPVGMEKSTNAGQRMVFATSDPARIELDSFLRQLRVASLEVRYAPEGTISFVIDRIKPFLRNQREEMAKIINLDDVIYRAA